jgi:error-prone DNA polymerase
MYIQLSDFRFEPRFMPFDPALPAYAELHCVSNFSFLRGASSAEELVERAHELGYTALAITDECSLAGMVRAHVAAKFKGLKLIVGAEFRLDDGLHFILLAVNRQGYGNLSELITKGRRSAEKGSYALSRADLADGVGDCLAIWIPPQEEPDVADALWLATLFPGALWIAAELHLGPDDGQRMADLEALSAQSGVPLVATGDVHMHVRSRRALQDTLTAIRLKTTVAEAGYALHPNGERHLRSTAALVRLYPPALLAESVNIAARCTFSLDELRYEYPEELVPVGATPTSYLRELTEEGLRDRYPGRVPDKVRDLVEKELKLIAELRYESFFLTVHDIVRFARSQHILCQGRGSAANSVVCFALHITEVNPSEMDVLFERFVSKERNEPPDIDVDFEHQRREQVMQYVYNKYGRERAAIAATVISYRSKSAVRDVGKALGLDLAQVDRLAKLHTWWDTRGTLPERLREGGFDPDTPVIAQLIGLTSTLIGFPRHLSQHVGGFVISRDALSRLVPIENASMINRTIIQWDKDDIDALGLLKVDCLALGMLSAIRRTLDLISDLRGRKMGMWDIPHEDPATYEMIQHADTIGVFQIESRAQMSMLPRLKPKSYYDLVIEVAIVRPGPIQGGMVHPYLRRRDGKEPIDYPPALEEALGRTLGVPIFQEQVMQIAMIAADFTPGEADQLRRSMAAWKRKGGLGHFKDRLIESMVKNGYKRDFAERIFKQIQGFGEYGFPESHAASFALLAYFSAWLKCHEPAAFTCGLLNSLPMGFYQPAQLLDDVRRHGVELRPIDVMISGWDCALEPAAAITTGQPALRIGLRLASGLSDKTVERIVDARAIAAFDNVEDLAKRAQLSRHDLDCLAAAGALAPLAGHRYQAYWQAAGVKRPGENSLDLLAQTRIDEEPIVLPAPTEGQNILADYGSLGFTLGRHPLALLRDKLRRFDFCTAEEVRATTPGRKVRTAGIVTGRQRPGTASGVTFVTIEDETGFTNVIVWRDLAARQHTELVASDLMGVEGIVEREGEVVHVIAHRLSDHSAWIGRLATHSRDFH